MSRTKRKRGVCAVAFHCTRSLPDFYSTSTDPLYNHPGSHPDRIEPNQKSRSVYIVTVRPDTRAYTSSNGMDPILSDPTPELIHPPPDWIRSYPIRCLSLHTFFRNRADRIRSDTGVNTSSSGMGPTLSDPIPELIHYLPVWSRSYPIPTRTLDTVFRMASEPILSATGT